MIIRMPSNGCITPGLKKGSKLGAQFLGSTRHACAMDLLHPNPDKGKGLLAEHQLSPCPERSSPVPRGVLAAG